jgi:hypothetical protein
LSRLGLSESDAGPCQPSLFDDVIDPVQPKHSHDNQIDRDGVAHDARRDHEKYPERGDRNSGFTASKCFRKLYRIRKLRRRPGR